MKCNLDCSYCDTGIYGGHDNTIPHPALEDCVKTIDFMFEYVDIYMKKKPRGIRQVILNVYGGESLHHPAIAEILTEVRQRYIPYQNNWNLTVTTTTNAIIPEHKLDKIIPLIDEFTVSYHTENTDRQKQQFRNNLLKIQASGRKQKCVVLMHSEPDKFADAQTMIDWLKQNNINLYPRALDQPVGRQDFNYQSQQIVWFESLYKKTLDQVSVHDNKVNLSETGRTCCGGRSLCVDQDRRNPQKFVNNKFTNWFCSVDNFFLFIKQVNGEVFVNRDCRTNYQHQVGPIGSLKDTQALLDLARDPSKPIIKCAKPRCLCGICAPKAADLDTYNTIMRKYEISNSNLL